MRGARADYAPAPARHSVSHRFPWRASGDRVLRARATGEIEQQA